MSQETRIPQAAAVVIVVGGTEAVIAATRSAAGVALAARVEEVSLSSAATAVSTFRPIAIVMTQDVYGFDADEFDALARDVGATVVRVDGSLDRGRLERKLMPKLGQIARERG